MWLLSLLTGYKAELRADLRRCYGLDLDWLDGRYTVAYIADLAANLPPGGAVHKAIDPAADWGHTDRLLAIVANHLAAIRYMLGGGKGARPQPIEPPRRPTGAKRVDLEGYLARLRAMQRPSKEVG